MRSDDVRLKLPGLLLLGLESGGNGRGSGGDGWQQRRRQILGWIHGIFLVCQEAVR